MNDQQNNNKARPLDKVFLVLGVIFAVTGLARGLIPPRKVENRPEPSFVAPAPAPRPQEAPPPASARIEPMPFITEAMSAEWKLPLMDKKKVLEKTAVLQPADFDLVFDETPESLLEGLRSGSPRLFLIGNARVLQTERRKDGVVLCCRISQPTDENAEVFLHLPCSRTMSSRLRQHLMELKDPVEVRFEGIPFAYRKSPRREIHIVEPFAGKIVINGQEIRLDWGKSEKDELRRQIHDIDAQLEDFGKKASDPNLADEAKKAAAKECQNLREKYESIVKRQRELE